MKRLKRINKFSDISCVNPATCRFSATDIYDREILPPVIFQSKSLDCRMKLDELLSVLRKMDKMYPLFVLLRTSLLIAIMLIAIGWTIHCVEETPPIHWWQLYSPISVAFYLAIGYATFGTLMNTLVFTSGNKRIAAQLERDLLSFVTNLKIQEGDNLETIREKANKYLFSIAKRCRIFKKGETEDQSDIRNKLCKYRTICLSFGCAPITTTGKNSDLVCVRPMLTDEIITIANGATSVATSVVKSSNTQPNQVEPERTTNDSEMRSEEGSCELIAPAPSL